MAHNSWFEETPDSYKLIGVPADSTRYAIDLPKRRTTRIKSGDVLDTRLLYACIEHIYQNSIRTVSAHNPAPLKDLFADWFAKDWLVTSTLLAPSSLSATERYSSADQHDPAELLRLFGTNNAQRMGDALEWICGKRPQFWHGSRSQQLTLGLDGDLYISIGGIEKNVGTPCYARVRSMP